MADYKGDFREDSTVRFFFSTNNSAGGRVSWSNALEAADSEVIKDGNTTGLSTGVTITSDFDSKVGVHYCEVDMSATTFYAVSSDYALVLYPDETVDSVTVSAILAEWSCENRWHQPDGPRKNQDLADIPFYLVDETDHATPEPSLTPAVSVSKDGGAFAAGGGTITEVATGLYNYSATAGLMNADMVVFRFSATGADVALVAFKTV